MSDRFVVEEDGVWREETAVNAMTALRAAFAARKAMTISVYLDGNAREPVIGVDNDGDNVKYGVVSACSYRHEETGEWIYWSEEPLPVETETAVS